MCASGRSIQAEGAGTASTRGSRERLPKLACGSVLGVDWIADQRLCVRSTELSAWSKTPSRHMLPGGNEPEGRDPGARWAHAAPARKGSACPRRLDGPPAEGSISHSKCNRKSFCMSKKNKMFVKSSRTLISEKQHVSGDPATRAAG